MCEATSGSWVVAKASLEQGIGDLDEPGGVDRLGDGAIEIGAKPHVLDAGNVHRVGDRPPDRRHVRHRLNRYGAGRYMDYAVSPPELIAQAIATEIDRAVDWQPVERHGAARAAALIAPLI